MLSLALPSRSNRSTCLLLATILFISLCVGLAYTHLDTYESPAPQPFSQHSPVERPDVPITPPKSDANPEETAKYRESLRQAFLQEFYKAPIKVNEEEYAPFGVFESKLPQNPKWNEPLGKKLCIMDLDNRPFDEENQMFGPNLMSWNNAKDVHGISLGMLNHWLYAKIHGYQYYYVQANDDYNGEKRASWKKPGILAEILKKHDVCVYMDSDAIFDHLDLPLEWLMNYWEIDKKQDALSLSGDPPEDWNKDEFGRVYMNTGFIITQNNKKAYEILKDWDSCPEEGSKFKGCDQFKKAAFGRPTDQGAFGTYIRYAHEKNIHELPCDEANGFPGSGPCNGKFIRHIWSGKDSWIKVFVGEKLPGKLLELFHEQMKTEKKDYFRTENELKFGKDEKMKTDTES